MSPSVLKFSNELVNTSTALSTELSNRNSWIRKSESTISSLNKSLKKIRGRIIILDYKYFIIKSYLQPSTGTFNWHRALASRTRFWIGVC